MKADAVRVWKQAGALLEAELSVKDYQTWIRDLGPRHFEDNRLVLEAPFGLYRDKIRRAFLTKIEHAVSRVAGSGCRVALVVDEEEATTPAARMRTRSENVVPRPAPSVGVVTGGTGGGPRGQRRSFETFLVGESNRMAYLAARHIVDGSLGGANPVFLYGEVGLGKTHLLMAVFHALRAEGRRVLYLPGEEFTRRMVDALKSDRMDKFRHEFKIADALLIDDVQCMVGKKRTQQELAQAFNILHAAGKPIAFASDRAPTDIETFEQGLKNRFQGGLITELRAPDKELRTRILTAKLAEAGLTLNERFVARVSGMLSGSIREIEGVVANIRLVASGRGGEVEDAALEAVIAPFLKGNGPVSFETVLETVAWGFNVSREEILSRARTRRVSLPRHVVAYLCRKLTPASSTEIGDALGGRNHTSVIRACRWISDRAGDDPGFASRLAELERMLRGGASRPSAH